MGDRDRPGDPSSGQLETLPARDAPAVAATVASGPAAVAATVASGAAATGPAPSRELPEVGASRYAIGDEVGRGGLGRVLRARDRVLDREVAVKELIAGDDGARRRFVREALITARLQHPSIVSVYEAGRWHDGAPFYAMKLVAGRPLSEAIAGAATLDARLALVPTVLAVADAIAYAHARRIVHRDLKPGNVLVGEFGETVVIDWGLAKDLSVDDRDALDAGPYREAATDQTIAGAVMGTPAYMAPEQAAGEDVDERADVYALGAMLYHVLTGGIPHEGKTLDDVIRRILAGEVAPLAAREPRVPADLATIVAKAMARAPADRYPTAKELADDLRRFQTGQLVGAHRYSRLERLARWIRRHRAVVAVAAVCALVLIVYGTWSVRRIVRETAVAQRARDQALASADAAEKQRDAALASANRALVAQAHDALQRNSTEALVYLRQLDPSVDAGWSAARLIASDVLSRPREIAAIDQLPPRGEMTIPVPDDAGRHVVIWNTTSVFVLDLERATVHRAAVGVDLEALRRGRSVPQFCDDGRTLVAYGKPAGEPAARAISIDLATGAATPLPAELDWHVAYARCARQRRAVVDGGEVRFWDDRDGAFHAVGTTAAIDYKIADDGSSVVAIDGEDLVRWTRAGVARRVHVGKGATIRDHSIDTSIVIAGADRKEVVWHLDTGARVPLPEWPGSGRLSPDDRLVAIGTGLGVGVVDARTGEEQRDYYGDGLPDRVSWSPDGRWIVARRAGSIVAWDTRADGARYELVGHAPNLMWWTQRGLLSYASDETLRMWSFDGVGLAHRPAAALRATSADGRWQVTSDGGTLVRTDTTGRAAETRATIDHGRGDLTVGPDGAAVLAGAAALVVWPRDGAPAELDRIDEKDPMLEQLVLRHAPREHLARSPDGRWAAIGRPRRAVELFDLVTLAHHPLDGSAGIGVAFLPDGGLVTGGVDGGLLRWDPRDGGHRALVAADRLRYGEDMPFALAASPDGRTVALGGGGSAVTVIDVATGAARALERAGTVDDLVFFAGGRALAGSSDQLAIWDVASGYVRRVAYGWPKRLRADGDAVTASTFQDEITVRDDLPTDPRALLARIRAAPGIDDAEHPRVPHPP